MKRILSLLLALLLFCIPAMAEDTDTALTSVPVGEEGIPFLGEWRLEAIEMDGTSMNPAQLGMEMVITLTEDGLVSLYDGSETMQATWFVSYGVAVVDGALLKLREDGKLVLEEEGGMMIFTQGEVAASEELSEEALMLLLLEMMSSMDTDTLESELAPEHQGFVGDWHLCYCAADDLTGDLRRVGSSATLTLYEDYTGYLWCFPEAEGGKLLRDAEGSWINEEGVICFGEYGLPLCLLGDETSGVFLRYGTEADGYLIFSQNEQAVWTPDLSAAQPAAAAAEVPAPAPAQDSASTGLMEIHFICKQYTTGGITGDAAVLGAEYSVVFHDNGTADLTLAGLAMTALPYTVTEDGVYSINYYGTFFNCVPTEKGFDLDYYGTMTLHMVPEA